MMEDRPPGSSEPGLEGAAGTPAEGDTSAAPPEGHAGAPAGDAWAAPPPQAERDPFWGYSDLFLFAGLAIPSMLAGLLLMKGFTRLLHVRPTPRAVEILPAQFLGYAFLFVALWLMFRLQYGRPFWRSLGWTDARLPLLRSLVCGVATGFGVAMASSLIHTPTGGNPMTEMLKDRTSLILIAVFGVTLGPLCEELIFRGFLQPLLVRSLGAVPGILLASLPFGFLHLAQYGNSWRHALLVSAAGAAFGWMRHATGSTKASTIMHAAYNGLFFLALFAERRDLPRTW